MEKGLADRGHHSSSLKGHWLPPRAPPCPAVSEPGGPSFSLAPGSQRGDVWPECGRILRFLMEVPALVSLHGVYRYFP